MSGAVRIALAAIGAVCLLDLTTSAVPSFLDVFEPVASWPWPVRVLEGVGVLGLAPLARPALGYVTTELRALPGARWAQLILLLYVLGFVLAIAFRTELYPFSNVGMFSAVPASVDTTSPRHVYAIVLRRGAALAALPVLREASPASRLGTGWDYKTGWVLSMFGTSDTHALALVDAMARAHGYDQALRAEIDYDPMTGHTLHVQPVGSGP